MIKWSDLNLSLAGELKHGPLALIDEHIPIIFVMTKDHLYPKTSSALAQITARKGRPVIMASESDTNVPRSAQVIRIPETVDCLQGLLNVSSVTHDLAGRETRTDGPLQIIPLQLLSYHLAVQKGYDVGKCLAHVCTTLALLLHLFYADKDRLPPKPG